MPQKRTAVTIKEISKLANVSPATVSLVMNAKPGVGAETRERVLRIAQALDYKPNLVARSLVSGQSGLVAMLIASTRNPVFPELSEGVDQILRTKGYSLSIISTNDNESIDERELEAVRPRGFEGLITSSSLLNNRTLNKLVDSGFPVVSVLRRDYSCPGLDYVVADNIKGGYLATEHLIRMGYRRIAVIRGPQNTSTGIERLKGAIQAISDYGIELYPELVREGDFYMGSGYQAAKDIMALPAGKRPQAIYSCNDEMAVGVLEAFWELGIRVPEDVALIGFNNTDVTSLFSVALSTVSLQKLEMGRLAAKHLIERMQDGQEGRTPFQITLEPKLIIRKTCGFSKKEKYALKSKKNKISQYSL